MPRLALPNRFNQQPQQALELAPEWRRNAVILAPLRDLSGRDLADPSNTIVNSAIPPGIVNKKDGQALSFLTTNQILSTLNNVNPNTPFTVFARVTPGTLNTGYSRILETDFATSFYLGSNSGSQYAFIVNDTGTTHLESCIGGQQVVGQTDFVLGTFDGTNQITLYVNGIQTGTTTVDNGVPTTLWQMAIGRYPFSSAANWVGDISLVGFYSRAFSAQEIYSLAQNPWQLFKSPPRRIYTVASTGSTGSANVTNANDTVVASGTVTAVGTLARTNQNDTVVASGKATVTGSLAKTNQNDTSVASGKATATGTVNVTNANDTCIASGTVGGETTGSANVTNANDTSVASGSVTAVGALAKTNSNDTVVASGAVTATGTVNATNADDTCAASGSVSDAATGTADVTNADDTCAASGTITAVGTVAVTNQNDTSVASATAKAIGNVNVTNRYDTSEATGFLNNGVITETLTARTVRVKKPGVPKGTPEWLKTTVETMLGRRGNAIPIPSAQDLTFSSTPTKEECEALHSHVNDIRTALESLINRFDT